MAPEKKEAEERWCARRPRRRRQRWVKRAWATMKPDQAVRSRFYQTGRERRVKRRQWRPVDSSFLFRPSGEVFQTVGPHYSISVECRSSSIQPALLYALEVRTLECENMIRDDELVVESSPGGWLQCRRRRHGEWSSTTVIVVIDRAGIVDGHGCQSINRIYLFRKKKEKKIHSKTRSASWLVNRPQKSVSGCVTRLC